MTIELSTLPSGLRVITDHVPSVDSVALGIWADVGTRDEDLAHNGVAHMVEHMLFKGTAKRDAARIAEEIEDVGGQVNAWTSREMTAYHIHLLKEDMPLALDVLADIVQNASMPEEEIARERHVILQEIGMTADTPDDLVFDHYQETAYPGQALGAPILGRAEIVGGMDRDTMMGYVRRFYTAKRLVVSAAGNVNHAGFAARVRDLFGGLPEGGEAAAHLKADYKGGESRVEKTLEQAHVVLGFRGVPRKDRDYYAATGLATILGGGMSSRLFQEIREKRGLVYSVFSFHSAYQDDGQFAVYAGTGADDLEELVPVLCDEILKATHTITEAELARARAQMKASLVMGRESMMSRAGQQAKQLIHFGTMLDVAEKVRMIDDLTLERIHGMAKRIFSAKPTLASLGPVEKLESYDGIVKRMAA
jgi:predicted Zn-dependent peptidase